jgi:hypothetical protein
MVEIGIWGNTWHSIDSVVFLLKTKPVCIAVTLGLYFLCTPAVWEVLSVSNQIFRPFSTVWWCWYEKFDTNKTAKKRNSMMNKNHSVYQKYKLQTQIKTILLVYKLDDG